MSWQPGKLPPCCKHIADEEQMPAKPVAQAADAANGAGAASMAKVENGCMVPHLHRTNQERRDWQLVYTSAQEAWIHQALLWTCLL